MKSQMIPKHTTHTRAQTANNLKLVFSKIMFFTFRLCAFTFGLPEKRKKMVHPVTQRVNEDLSFLYDFILTLFACQEVHRMQIFSEMICTHPVIPLIFKSYLIMQFTSTILKANNQKEKKNSKNKNRFDYRINNIFPPVHNSCKQDIFVQRT